MMIREYTFTKKNNDQRRSYAPTIETHYDFIKSKKDGTVYIKTITIISDIKPLKYFEVGISRALTENTTEDEHHE